VEPTLRDFGFRGFKCQITKHNNPRIPKEKNVELTFWYFRIRDFGISNVEPQHTTVPKFRKVKGHGTNTSGFWVSGFWGFKCQITEHNNPQSLKRKERGTNILGFWDSRFQDYKCRTTTHNSSRILKGERVWNQHFGISGFGVSNVK
jgi:hypothetical protein